MNSIAYYESMTPEQALALTKEAKGSTWYDDDWRPYCSQTQVPCDSRLTRMQKTSYGFRCTFCGNMAGHDLLRVLESPLNFKV